MRRRLWLETVEIDRDPLGCSRGSRLDRHGLACVGTRDRPSPKPKRRRERRDHRRQLGIVQRHPAVKRQAGIRDVDPVWRLAVVRVVPVVLLPADSGVGKLPELDLRGSHHPKQPKGGRRRCETPDGVAIEDGAEPRHERRSVSQVTLAEQHVHGRAQPLRTQHTLETWRLGPHTPNARIADATVMNSSASSPV